MRCSMTKTLLSLLTLAMLTGGAVGAAAHLLPVNYRRHLSSDIPTKAIGRITPPKIAIQM